MKRKSFDFKGDDFKNRYRITGILTTQSPLHIGTGETREDEAYKKLPESEQKLKKVPEIAEIARDCNGNPYLPGSTLRGIIRHYLLQLLQPINPLIAKEEDYEDLTKNKYPTQAEQIAYIRDKACMLGQLFGTPFHETKIEFWVAYLQNSVAEDPRLVEKGWDHSKQSYVVRSVAIDPETGAAAPNKLYSFDVAPPGQQYKIDVVGYNLDSEELGMLITGLCGFNSEIMPLQMGAMAGRGFGRMEFKLQNVYCLEKGDLTNWFNLALDKNLAGFDYLPRLIKKGDNWQDRVKSYKEAFVKYAREVSDESK